MVGRSKRIGPRQKCSRRKIQLQKLNKQHLLHNLAVISDGNQHTQIVVKVENFQLVKATNEVLAVPFEQALEMTDCKPSYSELTTTYTCNELLPSNISLPQLWHLSSNESNVFKISDFNNPVVTISIGLNNQGQFSIFVRNRELRDNHEIWKTFQKSSQTNNMLTMKHELLRLVKFVNDFKICTGICDEKLQHLVEEIYDSSRTSKSLSYKECGFAGNFSTIRHYRCNLLLANGDQCSFCQKHSYVLKKKLKPSTKPRRFQSKRSHWSLNSPNIQATLLEYKQNMKKLQYENRFEKIH